MFEIRPFRDSDWNATWQVIEPVFKSGETFAFSPDISEQEAYRVWADVPSATYVAIEEDQGVIGTYYIKSNQPGLGAHVCNCGYIVGEKARSRGVASEMCIHSQQEAKRLGYRAMQYNLVVATNEAAIRLWKRHGFDVVGTLPDAFQHRQRGFVDGLVMYKLLVRDKDS